MEELQDINIVPGLRRNNLKENLIYLLFIVSPPPQNSCPLVNPIIRPKLIKTAWTDQPKTDTNLINKQNIGEQLDI